MILVEDPNAVQFPEVQEHLAKSAHITAGSDQRRGGGVIRIHEIEPMTSVNFINGHCIHPAFGAHELNHERVEAVIGLRSAGGPALHIGPIDEVGGVHLERLQDLPADIILVGVTCHRLDNRPQQDEVQITVGTDCAWFGNDRPIALEPLVDHTVFRRTEGRLSRESKPASLS